MLVSSEHLGEIEVEESNLLHMPEGILGFPDARRFAVVSIDDGPYSWLQSVEDPALAFLTVVPWEFFPDYEPDVSGEDEAALELQSADEAHVVCLVTIDEDVTANLLGPVIINIRTNAARQVVLANSDHPVRASLTAG